MKKSSKQKQRFSATQQKVIWGVGIAVVAILSVFLAMKAIESTQDNLIRFFNTDDEINKLTVRGDDGFVIEKNGDEWLVHDRLEETDQFAVTQGLAVLNQWAGEKVQVKRQSVGLDFPRLVIRLDYADNSYKRVALGYPDPTGEGYYVEVQGDGVDGIYIIEKMMIDYFPLDVVKYLDTALLPWPAGNIESIQINHQSDVINLTTNSPYPEEETQANVAGWFIAEPYKHYHNISYAKKQELTESLQTMRMTELLEKDVTDWSTYGLDSSDFTIDFMTAEDKLTLVVGESATDDETYARIEGNNDLFTISNKWLELYQQSASAFHDGYVKILALDSLSHLSIDSDSLKVDITVEKDEENTYFKVDDKFLFEKGFREAYTAIAGLRSAGSSEGVTYGKPDVVITSTVELEDGQKEIALELVDYDEDHYAAFIDRESDFLIEKAHVEEMLGVIESVLEY